MAIKIIKDGIKEFHITCQVCGCEFTYENEDVCNFEVICPCCSTELQHKVVIGKGEEFPPPTNGGYGTITNPHGTYPYNDLVYRPFKLPEWATESDNWSGCEGCPNNPKYIKEPYVLDSPCQWCQKSTWKITCTPAGANLKR